MSAQTVECPECAGRGTFQCPLSDDLVEICDICDGSGEVKKPIGADSTLCRHGNTSNCRDGCHDE